MVMNMMNNYEKQIRTLSLRKCARLIRSIEKRMFEEMGKPIESRDMDFVTECLDTLDAIHSYVNDKNTAKKVNNSYREPVFVLQRLLRPAVAICLVMVLLLTAAGFTEAFSITRWSSKITWGKSGLVLDPCSNLHEEYSDGTEKYPTYGMRLQEFNSLDEAYERLGVKPLRLPSYMPSDLGEPKVRGYNVSYYRTILLSYLNLEDNRLIHLHIEDYNYNTYSMEIKSEEKVNYEVIHNFNGIDFYVYEVGATVNAIWSVNRMRYTLQFHGGSIQEITQILESF